MAKLTFTPRFISTASCPKGKKRICFSDKDTAGLILEVRSSEGRTFYARYRDQYGSQRNFKIGDASSVTLKAARSITQDILSKVALGQDPFAQKRERQATPTMAEFFNKHYLPYAKSNKRSWDCDVGLFKNHINPPLGARRVDAITTADIINIHHGLKRRGYAAGTCNRVLILIRYMFNLMIKWEIGSVTVNPSAKVNLLKADNNRQRFLTKEEVSRLHHALRASDNPFLYYIVSFLLLTGARKQEALRASWADFDFSHGFWLIPETKSGRPRSVPISDHLLRLLDSLPSKGKSPYLFPNPKTGKPYVAIYHSWNSARKQAGLDDVRMHDLRHSFASFLVNSGRSLYEVQKLLGHAHIKTTERYAHLSNDTLTCAVNTVGHFVDIDDTEAGPIIDITPKRRLRPLSAVPAPRGIAGGEKRA